MAEVTGRASDFIWGALNNRAPIIRWHPRSAQGSVSLRNEQLMPHRPVDVTWLNATDWTINLVPTMGGTVPETWFEIEIIELALGEGYTNRWWWPNKVQVPPEGGAFKDLPGAPISPEAVWVSLDPPPTGWPGWWLYSPAADQEMPLDDPLIGDLRRVGRG